MNPLDIIIIIIVGYGLIRGIFRGMIKEASSIIGVLAGFYAAYTYYPAVSEALMPWITNVPFLNIISFMILFCGVFMVIAMVGVVIKYFMNVASLGWIDRILGASLGFVKGILIVSVILVALTAFLPKEAKLVKASLLAPHVTLISENLATLVSDDMKKAYSAKITEIKKVWNGRH